MKMKDNGSRRRLHERLHCQIASLCLAFACLTASAAIADQYRSPYSVSFTTATEDLYAPNRLAPRDDWHKESHVPYEAWYSRKVRREYGVWGPAPRRYPPIKDYDRRTVAWKRQRVLAVACSYIGLPYQHHHIPDWDPPASWPWKQVAYGRNSKGVDCSDFTSWIYNYGLGIKLNTGIRQQAEGVEVRAPGDQDSIQIRTIVNDNGYDDLVKKLKTGDLLYIRNKAGKLAHVIMWVGEYGKSPDGTPLIIDCTGPDHVDCNGNKIPIGVQLRPFTQNGWYYKSFAHAHRIILDSENTH